ncbi:hypothetical protein MRX96_054201 [Rhipicephalus microplus]
MQMRLLTKPHGVQASIRPTCTLQRSPGGCNPTISKTATIFLDRRNRCPKVNACILGISNEDQQSNGGILKW